MALFLATICPLKGTVHGVSMEEKGGYITPETPRGCHVYDTGASGMKTNKQTVLGDPQNWGDQHLAVNDRGSCTFSECFFSFAKEKIMIN